MQNLGIKLQNYVDIYQRKTYQDMRKKIIQKLRFSFCNTKITNDMDKAKILKKQTRGESKINEIPM